MVKVHLLYLLLIVVFGILLLNYNVKVQENQIIHDARIHANVLKSVRKLYTSEVVDHIKNKVNITHNYKEKQDSIPLPATFSMMLGEGIKDVKYNLYSEFPFPWRNRKLTEFEEKAWEILSKNPEAEVYEFAPNGVKYAVADIMTESSCVSCHNSHEESPKTDWKIGDVRGVIEIDINFSESLLTAKSNLNKFGYFFGTLAALGFVGIIGSIWFFDRKSKEQLQQSKEQLQQSKEQLQQSKEQLQQSIKLEGIGRLAGGIAHDFNNLLTIINGYSEILYLRNRDDLALDILKSGERAASLTHQLLAFSRKQNLNLAIVDINILIDNLFKMLSRLIGEDVSLKLDLFDNIWVVKVDYGQIEQSLMNLVINSRDAMPNGGTIIIETKNTILKEFDDTDFVPGKYVMISVKDNGCGISKENLNKVFEPFFTTKEIGKGTGLGLASVYGIVKQSGGLVSVESEVGVGTEIKIYLPRVLSEQNVIKKEYVKPEPKNKYNILLVEDEGGVRQFVKFSLESLGHKVFSVDSPLEALKITERFDVLVTDVIMPGMNGVQLSEIFKNKYPETKIIYISGYTDDALVNLGINTNQINLLRKPFTLNDLSKIIDSYKG